MSFLSATGGYAARVVLLLALAFSANATPSSRFLYTGGHELDDARVAAIGDSYGTFTGSDAGWANALAGTYGPFDAILVGEAASSYSLSPTTKASIAAYVSNGGRVIVANDHYGNTEFLNTVFGYAATVNYGCTSDGSIGGSLQAAATGSTFAGGPATVGNLSCTAALNTASLPPAAKTIYAGSGTSLVVAANYGAGKVAWLGWDFCCGGTVGQVDDWYLVLDSAVKFQGFFTTCAAEGYTGTKLTLCRQICETTQTTTRLSSLVTLYTRAYGPAPACPAVETLR